MSITRTISITLDQAKKWYAGDNDELKSLALFVFQEDELKTKPYEHIKTFVDACKYLNMDCDVTLNMLRNNMCGVLNKKSRGAHLAALYKMDIILRALNKDGEYDDGKYMSFDDCYYPCLSYIREDLKDADKLDNIVGGFHMEGENYLVILDCIHSFVSIDESEDGFHKVDGDVGLLGCRTLEIAKHLGKHFAHEIFDLFYANRLNYTWGTI